MRTMRFCLRLDEIMAPTNRRRGKQNYDPAPACRCQRTIQEALRKTDEAHMRATAPMIQVVRVGVQDLPKRKVQPNTFARPRTV